MSRFPFLTVLAVLAPLAACTAGDGKTASQQAGGKADGDGVGALGATSHCDLLYVDDTCGGGTVCATATVDQLDVAIDPGTYPMFSRVLGTAEVPYTASVAANPEALADGTFSTTDGYYDLAVLDGTTAPYSSEAGIAMSGLNRTGFVNAGDLRVKTPPFTFADQTYDSLEVLCYVTGN